MMIVDKGSFARRDLMVYVVHVIVRGFKYTRLKFLW
jgi:hypothetical protein